MFLRLAVVKAASFLLQFQGGLAGDNMFCRGQNDFQQYLREAGWE
jgi:hypothetical protein